jgi:hypothetical protein
MTSKTKLDSLIEAAWQVIETEFDPAAFLNWRRNAFDYLTETLGPDHHYTRHFQEFVQDAQAGPLLAGQGILEATKQQMPTSRFLGTDTMAPEDETSNEEVVVHGIAPIQILTQTVECIPAGLSRF